MLFPSEIFLFLFLPLTVLLYYGFFKRFKQGKYKNLFLFIASVLFYAYGEPVYVFLMLFVIFMHYLFGLLVHKFKKQPFQQKLVILIMILFDVLVFGYFKYADFIINNINALFHTKIDLVGVALPIGISFYTFQAISYVVDVYREQGTVQTNPLNVGLYISLFPQLIAGPIVRYETIAKQIDHRKESFRQFSLGMNRFIIGLGKKVLLANQFAIVADAVFENVKAGSNSNSMFLLWLGAISYTLQIFYDFAGYSDMAIGLGKMFGFRFEENFNYPYIANSISEFWRRWHISLQTWFRDYVYIPLGGSRVDSKARLIFNIFIVWLLTGIWHGANWTFIFWGLMYFVLILLERFTSIHEKLGKFQHLYTLFFVMLGWIFFRSDSLSIALTYVLGMIGIGAKGIFGGAFLQYLRQYLVYYCAGVICCFPILKTMHKKLRKNIIYNTLYVICMLGIFALSVFFIFSNAYSPFIYFNF